MPNGWCITNIGEILINRDGERKPVSSAIRSKQENKIYDYYGAAGVIDKVDDYLFDERLLLIGEDGANLLSRSKNNAFFAEGKYWVNNHAHVLDATDKSLLDYVAIVINAIKLDDYVTGSAQPKLSQDNLNKIPIFLPPLEEQKRVLVEIERWFALIDQIEQGKADLQTFINKAKSKILDLAINGKLVAQDPNEEPASELLKRINPNAEITCDNGHYENLPKGWGLYKLGDVARFITDFVANGSFASLREHVKYYDGKEYAIIVRTKDFQNNFTKDLIYTDKHGYDFLSKSKLFGGELMLPNIGASIGKVFIIPNLDYPMTLGPNSVMISFEDDITKSWAYYVFLSPFGQELLLAISSSTAQGKFNKTDLRNIFFPLPPLAEQRRIVDAIDKAFAKLDVIMESL